jgi:hypothetical protein
MSHVAAPEKPFPPLPPDVTQSALAQPGFQLPPVMRLQTVALE